jgi:predicted AAA+ superfamily ATPase
MDIREILVRQRKELELLKTQRLVERERKVDVSKPIIKVVTGVRRAGKSTLCYLLLKNRKFAYVNFDDREILDFKSTEIEKGVKEIYGDVETLFLDEIQNYERWELWVNSLYRRGYNIVITGSNAKLLSRELSTHLTGRYIEVEVFPFSFREVLKYLGIDSTHLDVDKEKQGKVMNLLKSYLERGGFPEVWVKDLGRDFLQTLFENIIYKDVVKRWSVRHPSKIEELAIYLITNFSSKYSITKLKNALDFRSKETVKKYIAFLEESYLIFSLNNFSFKVKEVLKIPRKVYVVDTGLINSVSHKFSENLGRLMENLVFLELRKRYKEIFYFQTKEGYEVDFLIKEGLRVKQLIQVTYANSFDEIDRREWRALLKAYELFKAHKPELIIITWDYEDEKEISWFNKRAKIKFIPLWKWLLF